MTVNFENCFNLERVIMPYSDSLERPEISQPLKGSNTGMADMVLKIGFNSMG